MGSLKRKTYEDGYCERDGHGHGHVYDPTHGTCHRCGKQIIESLPDWMTRIAEALDRLLEEDRE